jgi:hypothetical protein
MRSALIVFVILFFASGAQAASWEKSLELSAGVFFNEGSNLVLLGVSKQAKDLLGQRSYWQLNAGFWGGEYNANLLGIARGVQLGTRKTFVRLSSGVCLISKVSDRLSTNFQFYEQLMVYRRLGAVGLGLSYRHWSNGSIKMPNWGMDFAGAQLDLNW